MIIAKCLRLFFLEMLEPGGLQTVSTGLRDLENKKMGQCRRRWSDTGPVLERRYDANSINRMTATPRC